MDRPVGGRRLKSTSRRSFVLFLRAENQQGSHASFPGSLRLPPSPGWTSTGRANGEGGQGCRGAQLPPRTPWTGGSPLLCGRPGSWCLRPGQGPRCAHGPAGRRPSKSDLSANRPTQDFSARAGEARRWNSERALLVAQADITNEMQRRVLSEEPLGSLLQDEVSRAANPCRGPGPLSCTLGLCSLLQKPRLRAQSCCLCPPGAWVSPGQACRTIGPRPWCATLGTPALLASWLMVVPRHAGPPRPPTPGDVTSPPTGVVGLARVTWLALVTVC